MGLRHATASRQLPIKTEGLYAPLELWILAELFKHNAIYLIFTFQKPSNSSNDSSLLVFYVLWKLKAEYMV